MSVSGQLCRLCKSNFAALMAERAGSMGFIVYVIRIIAVLRWQLLLDEGCGAAYISLRRQRGVCLIGQTRCQSRTPQAARHLEPPPRTGARCLVLLRALLRRARSRAGQVRDAASGKPGRRFQGQFGRALWHVSPRVLSGRSGSRPGRPHRPVTPSARTQERSQAHLRGHGIHRAMPRTGARDACTRARWRDQGPAKPLGPSANDRTRAGAEKKTLTSCGSEPAVAERFSAPALPPQAISTYEILRTAVLTEQARPEGLGAVVYHGMLRGLAVILSEVAPGNRRSCGSVASIGGQDRDLVHLMANMLLHAQSEVRHVY
jgi:hypothetical protein